MKKGLKKILVTGGAGFIGSNLALELQERFPEAWVVVVDDFRSGNFENLREFKGDVVGADVSRLDWEGQFGKERFDAIFHEASITDTTEHDQLLQVHAMTTWRVFAGCWILPKAARRRWSMRPARRPTGRRRA
jgi:ADP-L-glycero-D-manno-heptose 6-epimerase